MKITYAQEMQKHYLVLEEEGISGEEYVLKMLERNPAPPFLRLQMRSMNGAVSLLYDVSGRQPLSVIFERKSLGYEDIVSLLKSIDLAYGQAQRLLLDPSAVLLSPDLIFRRRDNREAEFLYFPGGKKSSIRELAEFVLKKLDHADPGTVQIGYAFYEHACEDRFDPREILEQTGKGTASAAETAEGLRPRDRSADGAAGAGFDEGARYIRYDDGEDWIREEAYGTKPRPQAGSRGRRRNDGKLPGRNGRKSRKKKAPARSSRGKTRKALPEKEKKKLLAEALGIAGVTLLYGLLVWLLRLDLFQMFGLFTLMIAVIWLAVSTAAGKWDSEAHFWDDLDFGEEEDEEEFLAALLEDEEPVFSPDRSENAAGYGSRQTREAGYEEDGMTGGEAVSEDEENGPQTRYLGVNPGQRFLCLTSEDIRRSRDLEMESEVAVIGKAEHEADLFIRHESVSRTHAKIERDPVSGTCFLTDLNSTNGTFINRVQAVPFRKYPLKDGDRVSFAAVHFRVRI